MPLDLDRLYDAHAPALYAFLLNVSRQDAEARDAVQEIFLRLARKPEVFDDVRDERAFLLRLGHRLLIDRARRHQAHAHAIERAAQEPLPLFTPAEDPD